MGGARTGPGGRRRGGSAAGPGAGAAGPPAGLRPWRRRICTSTRWRAGRACPRRWAWACCPGRCGAFLPAGAGGQGRGGLLAGGPGLVRRAPGADAPAHGPCWPCPLIVLFWLVARWLRPSAPPAKKPARAASRSEFLARPIAPLLLAYRARAGGWRGVFSSSRPCWKQSAVQIGQLDPGRAIWTITITSSKAGGTLGWRWPATFRRPAGVPGGAAQA